MDKSLRVWAAEGVFPPPKLANEWGWVSQVSGKVISLRQPAHKMKSSFREAGKYRAPYIYKVLSLDELRKCFREHGMTLPDWDVYLAHG